MQKYIIEGHEPSFLPDNGNFKLVWSDEFDGNELDRTKWDFRLEMMNKTHSAWTDKGVMLDGKSNAVFTVLEENGKPVSSQLQTGYNFMDKPIEKTTFGNDHLQWNIGKLNENKYTHCYGYYECRCKLQQKEGWWSAFWLQSPIIGASSDPAVTGTEIDIMECFKPGDIAAHNAFTGGYGLDMKRKYVGGMNNLNKEEFHRFGVLWNEKGYTFYIDGVEDGHISDYVSHIPQFILITTEVSGYRYENHEPVEKAYQAIGDKFVVDYVRVFEQITD